LTLEEELHIASPFGMEGAYRVALELLEKRRDFTALFALSDVMAIGAMRALRENALAVPRDVSVIGFDGIEMARFLEPPLATVEQPAEEIARAGVELMLSSWRTRRTSNTGSSRAGCSRAAPYARSEP
jgi:LacI family transcriptional regulator